MFIPGLPYVELGFHLATQPLATDTFININRLRKMINILNRTLLLTG